MFAPDAHAWELQTHLFFAQCAVFLVPFDDRELRAAVSRFPRLVLAGACLPDLALAGRALGTPAFLTPHLGSAVDDPCRAIALEAADNILDALAGPRGAINAARSD